MHPPRLEVTYPNGLGSDLVAAAETHAQERLDRFMTPMRGYAFEGSFESKSEGEIISSDAALGLLVIEDPWVTIRLSDLVDSEQLVIGYQSRSDPEGVTLGHPGVACPADLPVPVPSEPFRLPPTICEAVEGGADVEFSVDVRPVPADEIDWVDLLFLNDLRPSGTPSNREFESADGADVVIDQASYRSGTGDLFVYVDYEAHWKIVPDCPSSSAIVQLDILHAESCDTSGHTHGRYDSACSTIATLDGRPDWAGGF
ncbi:MAG: hypothetical protein IAG13_07525 [Deltaproteobacteria bacterium]|nr:hypothetical protein [Nannocystaceae bacterium]